MRIRAGLWMPSCRMGGSEVQNLAVLRLVDRTKVVFEGVGVFEEQGNDLEVIAEVERLAPVFFGSAGLRWVADQSDVVVQWGIPDPVKHMGFCRPRLLMVSHVEAGLAWWDERHEQASPAVDRFVAVGASALGGVPAGRRGDAIVIPNCVEAARVWPGLGPPLRRELGVPDSTRVLLSVCRLAGEKRPWAVFDTLDHLPAHFVSVVVGDGPLAAEIAARVATDPSRRLWAGRRSDIGRFYAAADYYVCGSDTEGFGLAMAEAMLSSVPVVARAGLGLLAEHPGIARESPDNSPEALAAAILADEADPGTRLKRTRRAHALMASRHSEANFGQAWTDLLEQEGRLRIVVK